MHVQQLNLLTTENLTHASSTWVLHKESMFRSAKVVLTTSNEYDC